MSRLAIAMLASSALFLSFSAPTIAASRLSLLNSEKSEVKPKAREDRAAVRLLVFNEAPGRAELAADFQAMTDSAITIAGVEPQLAAPGEVTEVTITLGGLSALKSKVAGHLVLSGGGGAVAKAVEVTPAPKSSRRWARDIVVGSALATILLFLVLVLAVGFTKKFARLIAPAPGPEWKFSDSWATTLTAAGAVLGTVLGSATLPDSPREIDKTSFIGLNLLFGTVVVLAPFLFQAIRNPRVSAADAGGLWGFNLSLLAACCLTFGAVVGEVTTLALVAGELIDASAWRTAADFVAISTGLLALWYFGVTAWWLAGTDWKALADEDARKAATPVVEATKRATLSGDRPTVVVASAPVSPRRWSLP